MFASVFVAWKKGPENSHVLYWLIKLAFLLIFHVFESTVYSTLNNLRSTLWVTMDPRKNYVAITLTFKIFQKYVIVHRQSYYY